MMKIEWAFLAEKQLDEILNFYTRRNRSSSYSQRLKREIWKIIRIIRKNRYYGEPLSENNNQRRVSVGNFVLIYEFDEDVVYIQSIRDGRRDEE